VDRYVALVLAVAGCGRIGFDDENARAVATFDAASSDVELSASSLTWSHTAAAGDIALVVFVGTRQDDGGPVVTSAHYAGIPLERIEAQCPLCGGLHNNDEYELWVLPAPPAGTATIDIELAGVAEAASAMATSYGGTAGATPASHMSSFDTSTSATLSWQPGASATWAVAGLMVQGGLPMQLETSSWRVRTGPLCDDQEWQGQEVTDLLALAPGSTIDARWSVGSGDGPNCSAPPAAANWIALGAAFE
jgi:hypothetical protein